MNDIKLCICKRTATHEARFVERFGSNKGSTRKSYYCATHAIKGSDEYGITMYYVGTDEIDPML